MNFKNWLENNLNEVAIGPQSIQHSTTGFPSFRISILENGRQLQLSILRGQGTPNAPTNVNYKYAGDLSSEYFGETNILKGYKLFNYHADLPQGYGPMLYDIALEIATKNGGYLVSTTFINALKNLDPNKRKENKGVGYGGDTSDAAENVYKFYYYKRNDVKKDVPNIVLNNEADQAQKPYLYEIYSKQPILLNQLIQMNNDKSKQPVLVLGNGEPVLNLNF
jgi:hypothetical protein